MRRLIFFLVACRIVDAESFTQFAPAPQVTKQTIPGQKMKGDGIAPGHIANFRGSCRGTLVADRWDRGVRICYKVASAHCTEAMAGGSRSFSTASKGEARRSVPLHFRDGAAAEPIDGTLYLPAISSESSANKRDWHLQSLTGKEREEISPEVAANDIALVEYVCSERPRESMQPLCRWTNQISIGRTLYLGDTWGKRLRISGKSPFGPAVLSAGDSGATESLAPGPLILRDGVRTCLAGFLVAAAGAGRWVATDREARGFLQELLTTLRTSQEQPRSEPSSHEVR